MRGNLNGVAVAVAGWIGVAGGASGCEAPPDDDPVHVGLLLSYTGFQAADSINSERALRMAIETANLAGGVEGRRLQVVARDTRSDPRKVTAPTRELIEAGSAVIIGPDNSDLVTMVRPLLEDRTILLPSFSTASDLEWKPDSWFVMGAGAVRVACELNAQYKADGRSNVMQLASPSGYDSSLSYVLNNNYSLPRQSLADDLGSDATALASLIKAMESADGYVLAAPTTVATSLVYGLIAAGALGDPTRWYLSPTLHSPAFLASIPKGGVHGCPRRLSGHGRRGRGFPGAVHRPLAGRPARRRLPLLRRRRPGRPVPAAGAAPGGGHSRPAGPVHAPHRRDQAGGVPVKWNEIGRGLELLRQGQEIEYFGLTGQIQFDAAGEARVASTKWWAIGDDGFVDMPKDSKCN